jgi:uncharacterized membrane protein (GlpM family)
MNSGWGEEDVADVGEERLALAGFREQIRIDLERQFRKSYRFGLVTIAAYFTALLPYYLVAYQAPVRLPIVAVTGGAVVLLGLCLVLLETGRVRPEHFQILGVAGMALIATPIVLQLVLMGNERHHLEMGLLIVTNALIFHETPFFVGAEVTMAGAWIAAVVCGDLPGARVSHGLGIGSALVVAVTVHLILQGLLRNQADLRLRDMLREAETDRLNRELGEALERVRTLRGLVPICAHCKKIRDDTGFWQKVETYVESHSHAEFTHGLCPTCLEDLKGQFESCFPAGDGPPRQD